MHDANGELRPIAYVTKVISMRDPAYMNEPRCLAAIDKERYNVESKSVWKEGDADLRDWNRVRKEDEKAI